MKVKTYTLYVFFNGYDRWYHNLSRVAAQRYVNYHMDNPDYIGFDSWPTGT